MLGERKKTLQVLLAIGRRLVEQEFPRCLRGGTNQYESAPGRYQGQGGGRTRGLHALQVACGRAYVHRLEQNGRNVGRKLGQERGKFVTRLAFQHA